MFGRSEFGRRAVAAEEREGTAAGGECQERMVLVTFAEAKVTRRRRKLLIFAPAIK
jgi:hypothetical protein